VYRNGLNPVAELDGSGAVVNRYVYGEEDHVPALLLRGTSTYRLITDYLGSVRGVVDVSTGAVVQRRSYDTWGIVTTESAPDFQGLGYAGGLYEPATGLTRFGARDYEASVGRWTVKDPAGFLGGDLSIYVYVGEHPSYAVDASGLGRFLERPMGGMPSIVPPPFGPGLANSVADACGCELAHEEYFFGNGEHRGEFNAWGGWPFGPPIFGPDPDYPTNKNKYIQIDSEEYDDDLIRIAMKEVIAMGLPYLGIGANCQTFASLVRVRYHMLKASHASGGQHR